MSIKNKNTKEHDVKTHNQRENFLERTRNILEKNKIFFEIFSSVLLALMSITISIVSLALNKRSTEVYEKQLEILENDREPYFTMECKPINGSFEESDYCFTKKLYTITNIGGLISDAYLLEVETWLEIRIPNPESGQLSTYRICFTDLFEKTEGIISLYNEESKEFNFYSRENDKLDKIIHELEIELNKTYSEKNNDWTHTVHISYRDIIIIEYVNYKNESYHQIYQFGNEGKMFLMQDDFLKKSIFLCSINFNENTDKIIQEICKELSTKTGLTINKTAQRKKSFSTFEQNKKEAVSLAKRYLSTMPFSYDGLVEQLETVDNFSHAEAIYGVDNCGADWNEQAVKQANNYLGFSAYSHDKLVENLKLYEKFTHEQALYGADNCGANWNEEAARLAMNYLRTTSFSKNELIKLLEQEGFTHEQAVYGAEQNGY